MCRHSMPLVRVVPSHTELSIAPLACEGGSIRQRPRAHHKLSTGISIHAVGELLAVPSHGVTGLPSGNSRMLLPSFAGLALTIKEARLVLHVLCSYTQHRGEAPAALDIARQGLSCDAAHSGPGAAVRQAICIWTGRHHQLRTLCEALTVSQLLAIRVVRVVATARLRSTRGSESCHLNLNLISRDRNHFQPVHIVRAGATVHTTIYCSSDRGAEAHQRTPGCACWADVARALLGGESPGRTGHAAACIAS